MIDTQLSQLLAACDHVVKLPSPIPEPEAVTFLEEQPLDRVFQLLSTHECDPQQLDTICTGLSKVLASQPGTALLPAASPYAQAALSSPQHRLRRLGCEQLGRLLRLSQDEQQQQLETMLVNALQDADTGVAGEAEKGLVARVADHPASFAGLLSGSTPAGQQLQELAASSSATTRMRAFSLLVSAAATSSSAAEQLKHSGAVHKLLEQLNPADPLSCLVALQLLQELVPHIGGAAAQLMQQLLLPALLPLLDDPATAAGAFPISAQLVAAAASSSSGGASHMEVDGPHSAAAAASHANGNGVSAHVSATDVLLAKTAAVLDDRGSAGVEEEVVVLDAAHQLAQPSAESAALLASPPAQHLLPMICNRALGRTATPDVRLAALHALASVAGVERAGEARDRTAALLPAAAEDALRQGVYGAVCGAAGGVAGARSPSEAVWQLLQQPFIDTRTGVYRCCSALALRPWFAADVCNNSTLLSRLCTTDSESGQQACEWRHSTVMALWATVQYVLGLSDDATEAQYKQQLTPAVQQQLAAAVRGGPYGVGGSRGTQQSHFVATVP